MVSVGGFSRFEGILSLAACRYCFGLKKFGWCRLEVLSRLKSDLVSVDWRFCRCPVKVYLKISLESLVRGDLRNILPNGYCKNHFLTVAIEKT
ncbi:hypothetical protein JCM10003_3881 [Bacteroides pyogenes JCM 10003]|nr:hypothetical protein JCM10003_3881 [Bacteroides pyogenes JCM 10003]